MATVRELLRFLHQQGYRNVRQTGSHVILERPGHRVLVVPNHRGDIPKGLLARILKDAGFTWDDFLNF